MLPHMLFLRDAWAKQRTMMENLAVRNELSILIVEDDDFQDSAKSDAGQVWAGDVENRVRRGS